MMFPSMGSVVLFYFTYVKMEKSTAVTAFKVWVFPSLVSLLGLMIWTDVNEIKSDVKALMAQSNIDKTRIDNLERLVYQQSSPINTFYPSSIRPVAILPKNEFETKKEGK
jgi:hypothetical protein